MHFTVTSDKEKQQSQFADLVILTDLRIEQYVCEIN